MLYNWGHLEVYNLIFATVLVLDVYVELLKEFGPLLIALIQYFFHKITSQLQVGKHHTIPHV